MDVELISGSLASGISEPVMEILLCQRTDCDQPSKWGPTDKNLRARAQTHRSTIRDGKALLELPSPVG